MKPGDDDPVEEGGDPACWAHLFEDEESADDAKRDADGVAVVD